ncbi:transposase [Paraburkholderia sp. MM5496-R1]
MVFSIASLRRYDGYAFAPRVRALKTGCADGYEAIALVSDAKNFDNARQLAAWIGLVPRQNSSGGKNVLLGISKRGDTYLRTLLIHGARSVICAFRRKKDKVDGWLGALLARRNPNVAAVALANKNARIVWAMLARDREFRPDYTTVKAAA